MGLYAAQRAQMVGQLATEGRRPLADALEAYEVALAFDDSYDLLHANTSALLAASGDLESALDHMQRAAAIYPREARYFLWVADDAAALGQDSLARDAYLRGLGLDSSLAASAYWDDTPQRTAALAEFLSTEGLSSTPREVLSEVPATCWPWIASPDARLPADPLTLRCRGEIALRADEQPAEAAAWLDQAIATAPADGASYAVRAEAYLALGDLAVAEHDARTAIFLEAARGYYALGLIAEARGDVAAAEDHYTSAGPLLIQRQGWDVAVFGRRASLLLLPLPTFDAPGPTRYDFAGWLALARLYELQGRAQDAQAVVDAICALDPYFLLP
jgi:tetratricopeptide (TPR) repeat protein